MKKITRLLTIAFALMMMTGICFAVDFNEALKPVAEGIESFLLPVIVIVGAAGSIFCISLGVKYAKAEEPQDREKAKSHLKSAIIGFFIIFILIVGLKLMLPSMIEWMDSTTAESSASAS